MMVNATQFPGPALWQGLMLCLFPFVVLGMCYRNGKYMRYVLAAYTLAGAVGFAVIVGAR